MALPNTENNAQNTTKQLHNRRQNDLVQIKTAALVSDYFCQSRVSLRPPNVPRNGCGICAHIPKRNELQHHRYQQQ